MTTSWNGYVSHLAFLQAQRQQALELAERLEHQHGEGDPLAEAVYQSARRLAAQIEREYQRWER